MADRFERRSHLLNAEYTALVSRRNMLENAEGASFAGNGVFTRYKYPVITAAHTPLFWRYDFNYKTNPYLMERMGVNAACNAGTLKLNGRYCLAARIEGADGKSFFAVAESPTGVDNFAFHDSPMQLDQGGEPDVNVRAMRLTRHEDGWIYGLFGLERKDPSVSVIGIVRTKDLAVWQRLPDLNTAAPHQHTAALHPEFVDGRYMFYTSPKEGGIRVSFSDSIENDEARDDAVLDEKDGIGAPPIKTGRGWLHITCDDQAVRAFVTALDDPRRVIAHPGGCLFAVSGRKRKLSDSALVSGIIPDGNGRLLVYYRSSNDCLRVAETSVDQMLDYCFNTPPAASTSYDALAQRLALISKASSIVL
jgi:4-O-beta-D-mannosyl-D-glucose phosphorylase